MKFLTDDRIDRQTIYFINPLGFHYYNLEQHAVIENLAMHPISDAKKETMTVKKKINRNKPTPGNNAVGSLTVQYNLACGCKMEQRLDYKNTTTKRFRKTLLVKIYPEQDSQKNTQVTGSSFLTLVASPKCLVHHPNPQLNYTGLDYARVDADATFRNFKSSSRDWAEGFRSPTFVSIVTDITNAKLTESQIDSLISVLQGKES